MKLKEYSCPICNNTITTSFIAKDYISHQNFCVVFCHLCQSAHTLRNNNIANSFYYPATYYGSKGQRFLSAMEEIIRLFRRSRAIKVSSLFDNSAKKVILDIGCGRGLMLRYLESQYHWECWGTEISQELIENSNERIHVCRQSDFVTSKYIHYFDVITLYHVLEHIDDVKQLISDCHMMLKPGGYLIIEVPNFRSWQSRITKRRWFHLDVPRHLHHFSIQSLEFLINKRFCIINLSTRSMEYNFYGLLQSCLNFFTKEPNKLYEILKDPRILKKVSLIDILVHVTLILLIPFVILFEMLASLFNAGGTINITYRKYE